VSCDRQAPTGTPVSTMNRSRTPGDSTNHATRRLQTLGNDEQHVAYPQVNGVPPVGVEPTLGGF
jgi:hypothetical protein